MCDVHAHVGTYVLPAPSKRVDGLPFALVDGTLKRTLTPEVSCIFIFMLVTCCNLV